MISELAGGAFLALRFLSSPCFGRLHGTFCSIHHIFPSVSSPTTQFSVSYSMEFFSQSQHGASHQPSIPSFHDQFNQLDTSSDPFDQQFLIPNRESSKPMGCFTIHLQPTMVGPYNSYSNNSISASMPTDASTMSSPRVSAMSDLITDLREFLPSNNDKEGEISPVDSWPPLDAYSSDDFRMYEFKVRRCTRPRNHDWMECPFKHPGEKAARRDPRRVQYVSTPCPELKKGSCRKGDGCEYAHGVFECWLHPARYRTQPCKDRTKCTRRVCFFAHTIEQLRLPSPVSSSTNAHSSKQSLSSSLASNGYGSSSSTKLLEEKICYTNSSPRINRHLQTTNDNLYCSCADCLLTASSPTSILVAHPHSPPSLSPPLSPASSDPFMNSWPHALARSLSAQASTSPSTPAKHSPSLLSPASRQLDRGVNLDYSSVPVGSLPPQAMTSLLAASLQNLQLKGCIPHEADTTASNDQWLMPRSPAFHDHVSCLPGAAMSTWACQDGLWESNENGMERATANRVESGHYLRAKIYEKIAKENASESEAPDLGWVNNLVK